MKRWSITEITPKWVNYDPFNFSTLTELKSVSVSVVAYEPAIYSGGALVRDKSLVSTIVLPVVEGEIDFSPLDLLNLTDHSSYFFKTAINIACGKPDKSSYTVVVSNVGTVYEGDQYSEAHATYAEYQQQSRSGYGRAAGEPVTLFEDGEIVLEYLGRNQ